MRKHHRICVRQSTLERNIQYFDENLELQLIFVGLFVFLVGKWSLVMDG